MSMSPFIDSAAALSFLVTLLVGIFLFLRDGCTLTRLRELTDFMMTAAVVVSMIYAIKALSTLASPRELGPLCSFIINSMLYAALAKLAFQIGLAQSIASSRPRERTTGDPA